MKRKLTELWKKSFILAFIQKIISKRLLKRLENENFTILSSNCIAGIIYNRLGRKFLTPTINMFMSNPDFVSFCLYLDDYISQVPEFVETNESYPVAELGGGEIPVITLHFNHSKTNEDALSKWEERKKRINKDNLYIIMYNLDGVTKEQIKMLDSYPCNNKIVLTACVLDDISWSHYIKPVQSHTYASSYLSRDFFGVPYFEKKFDFVEFLNKK